MTVHAETQTARTVETLTARLRMKRWFLMAMVISLAACAAVAIAALLLSQFNDTTGRILATLGALAFHSGMAMTCAASLERRQWPALSVAGLILFSINFVVMIACIWWPGWDPGYSLRSVATTAALMGFYAVAIPCAAGVRTGRWRPLPQVGVGACVLALLMLLICIWAEHVESKTFGKLTGIAVVVAFSLSQNCLLGRVPAMPALDWLLKLAVVSLWTMALIASCLILTEAEDEFMTRVAGAVGVLDAAASLGLVIMAKVKQVARIEQLESATRQIEIHCPRCTAQQVVDAGASTCHSCGLRFRIDIEEPRCAKCGYLLWQLPQRRCPECGTTF